MTWRSEPLFRMRPDPPAHRSAPPDPEPRGRVLRPFEPATPLPGQTTVDDFIPTRR